MTYNFDPYQPNILTFVGRESLVETLITSATNKRCALLFGGRQSGKTSVLLKIVDRLKRDISVATLDSFVCPIYVDLTLLPIDAQPTNFFSFLVRCAVQTCRSSILGFEGPELQELEINTIDDFAKCIRLITSSAGEVDLTLLFLIDEAERVLGERFPRGFQDNLFSVLYGPELSGDVKLGIVFAGAQGLYKFSEDQTSPIGSRAAYIYIKCLSRENISSFVGGLKEYCGIEIALTLEDEIYLLTGGHAGLTARLFSHVAEANVENSEQLLQVLDRFRDDSRQLLRLWATALTPKARALNDRLATASTLSRKEIFALFQSKEWDPLLAERAIDELKFTGLADYNGGVLSCVNQIYWGYLRDSIILESEEPANTAGHSEIYDLTWGLIEQAEIALRSYVRSVYISMFGDQGVEGKIGTAIGLAALEKVRGNVRKSNARYKYTAREEELGIFDGLYLGQLGQLMVGKDAWSGFSHVFQDKRELEILLGPINSVRTDKAHFYKVPERELTRCKLHCEDLLAVIEKHMPKGVF